MGMNCFFFVLFFYAAVDGVGLLLPISTKFVSLNESEPNGLIESEPNGLIEHSPDDRDMYYSRDNHYYTPNAPCLTEETIAELLEGIYLVIGKLVTIHGF